MSEEGTEMSASITGVQQPTAFDTTSTTTTGTTGTTGTTSTGTTGSDTITAADFMTLLVAEMKNQDPTQPSDPTQYVQQLVGVNSLEQLIGINTGMNELTSALNPLPTT